MLIKASTMRFPRFMKRFKSPWFYWHTGQKRIALISLAMSGLVSGLVLILVAGCSAWSILLALLLDAAGLLVALVYVVVARWSIPAGFGLQAHIDTVVFELVLLPALVGFVLNRACAFLTARACGDPFAPPPACRAEDGTAPAPGTARAAPGKIQSCAPS